MIFIVLHKMLSQRLTPLLFFILHYVAAEQLTPSSGKLDKPARVYYCPFDAKVSLVPDVTALDITYTSKSSSPVFSQKIAKCFLQIDFSFTEINRTVAINEIEYNGELDGTGQGKVEARIAWDTDRGPVRGSS